MIIMYPIFVLVSALYSSAIQGLPQPTLSIDPTDPNKSDPTSMQTEEFTFNEFKDAG